MSLKARDVISTYSLSENLIQANFSNLTVEFQFICSVIIGRNPIEVNANTVAIQPPGNPVAYIGKCFTPY